MARTSDGTPLATCLSTSGGGWSLRGLSAGAYTLYAAPLDGPVTASNLTTFGAVATDFGATMLGSVVVGVAGTTAVGKARLLRTMAFRWVVRAMICHCESCQAWLAMRPYAAVDLHQARA